MDLFGGELDPPEEIIDVTEAPPVEIERFAHPRTMNICLGHEEIEQKMLQSFKSGHMPHGLIFSGPKGIGKATMAYKLTKTILGHENLVNSGGHPDLMSVERLYDPVKNTQKASVEVAEIRKVTPFLRMTASYGGWRIVIIDDADTMNRNAQNALLKILEEPPKNTLIILVAHRLGTLIPTIRSRTQLINFHALSPDILSNLLSQAGHDLTPNNLQTLISMSGGSFGRAQQLLEEGGLETLDTITSTMESYPNWDWPAIHALADTLGRAGQNKAYDLFAELMIWVFSELALVKAKGQQLDHVMLTKPALESLLKNSSLEQLLKICENLNNHFAKVSGANLDKRQGVLHAFSLITA